MNSDIEVITNNFKQENFLPVYNMKCTFCEFIRRQIIMNKNKNKKKKKVTENEITKCTWGMLN